MKQPTSSNKIINNFKLKGDPILYFLNSKLSLSPIIVGLISIFFAAIMIPWAKYTGVWSGDGMAYPLFESFHTWIGDIVLGLTNALILYYYLSFPRLFKSLYQYKIIDDGIFSFESLYSFIYSKIFNKRRHLIVLVFSVIVTIIMQNKWLDDGLHGWTEINSYKGMSFLGYYHFIYFALELSIIVNFIINVFYTIIVFRKIREKVISNQLKYNFVRLCQYSSGGLKPLGQIAMQIIMVLFTLGIYTSLVVFSMLKYSKESGWIHDWQILEISLLLLYIILSPSIFFLLLTPIHQLMKWKKNSLYKLLVLKDNEVVTLEKDSLKELFTNSKSIEKIRLNNELFSLINELPTWPFNLSSISKLITMTILPILPIILEIIVSSIAD